MIFCLHLSSRRFGDFTCLNYCKIKNLLFLFSLHTFIQFSPIFSYYLKNPYRIPNIRFLISSSNYFPNFILDKINYKEAVICMTFIMFAYGGASW